MSGDDGAGEAENGRVAYVHTQSEACVLKTWQHRLDLVAREHAATRARKSQQPGGVEDVFTCLVRDGRRKPLRKSYTACNTTNNNRLRTRETRHAHMQAYARRADNRHADRGNHRSSERGGTSFGVLHVWSRPRHVPSPSVCGQMRQASLGGAMVLIRPKVGTILEVPVCGGGCQTKGRREGKATPQAFGGHALG